MRSDGATGHQRCFRSCRNDNPLKLTHQTADVLRNLVQAKGISLGSLVGIGMGCQDRSIRCAAAICCQSIPAGAMSRFADAIEAELNIPTVVEHNVTAMALAEAHYGIGQAARLFFMSILVRGCERGWWWTACRLAPAVMVRWS
ncbi:ROK family protein [Brucella abortus]|nr:ROK family protein [Brucella abortus]